MTEAVGVTALAQPAQRAHSAQLFKLATESGLFDRFAPKRPPPTRRQRTERALREAWRRIKDAWKVLVHGVEIDDWRDHE